MRALAERTARLLSRDPSDRWLGLGSEKAAFNALALAAGLADGEHLTDALEVILRERALHGEYDKSNLRSELRVALVLNQVDSRFLNDWRMLLWGGYHDYLPGTRLDGLEGIIRVRLSFSHRDEPLAPEVGRALAKAAEWLNDAEDREAQFHGLLVKVETIWPIQWHFRSFSKQYSWPEWAASLTAPVAPVAAAPEPELGEMPEESLAMACVVGALWSHQLEPECPLLRRTSRRILDRVEEAIEKNVQGDPYRTRTSRVAIEHHALLEVAGELKREDENEMARVVEDGAKDLLKKAHVISMATLAD